MIERVLILVGIILTLLTSCTNHKKETLKPRVIVTSDGEIDDECSMVRFLLYANEFDVEGIVTSSSQYHWRGHRWAGDNWFEPYLEAYSDVYPNLILHDKDYPTPEYLKSISFVGNVETEGEMDLITQGSQHIVKVLLDESENQPIWVQAWGGTNTIARALKTIEEQHPDKMEQVASKLRFFFIWEQDSTYQSYIRPHWGRFNIPTIISDQFISIMYYWKQTLPKEQQKYFNGEWMKSNILNNHGPLCSLYKSHNGNKKGFDDGDFRSEGDSPSFLHNIENGLRNMESPYYGGWGGRYVLIRDNTWLDPVNISNYEYPEGRWYGSSAWGRLRLKKMIPNDTLLLEYLKPIWRWTDDIQNDFASRADWCVKSFDEANHPPVVRLDNKLDINTRPGSKIQLSANGTYDPDNDKLTYKWWFYKEPSSFRGNIKIENSTSQNASLVVPNVITEETEIHIICQVMDNGLPNLTRYKRVVINVKP